MTRYRQGYQLEKMIVDRLNKSGEWLCQRGPSSKGIDVLATSRKHYKNVFLECKNTGQMSYSIEREQVLELVRKGFVGGAEVYIYDLAKALEERGCRVVLVHGIPGGGGQAITANHYIQGIHEFTIRPRRGFSF